MKRKNLSCLNSNLLLLPLKKKVVFVDWFGVLSTDVFVDKYLNDRHHPYHNKVKRFKTKLFDDSTIVGDWMRGKYKYAEIIDMFGAEFSQYQKKVVGNNLTRYCESIYLNEEIFDVLRKISDKAFIVLATDNMDCFFQSLITLPQLGIFDFILSSNNLGVLKSDDPYRFFGLWLSKHNVTFNDSLLIDDSEKNCSAFKKAGGHYIRYTSSESNLSSLLEWVNS